MMHEVDRIHERALSRVWAVRLQRFQERNRIQALECAAWTPGGRDQWGEASFEAVGEMG